jgi:hypothetical protein
MSAGGEGRPKLGISPHHRIFRKHENLTNEEMCQILIKESKKQLKLFSCHEYSWKAIKNSIQRLKHMLL